MVAGNCGVIAEFLKKHLLMICDIQVIGYIKGLKNMNNTGRQRRMTKLNYALTIKNMSLKNRLVLPRITTNYGSSQA